MELDEIVVGLRVKITKIDEDIRGMFVAKKYLDARKLGAIGEVVVKHDDGTVGAYVFDEFEKE